MSVDCDNLREELVALAWGKLDRDARDDIKRHVDSCERCRAEVERLRSVRGLVRSVAEIEPRAGLHARIMAGVRQRGTPTGGPASRRLAVLAERDRPRLFTPRRRIVALFLSAATAAAVMLGFQAWKIAVRTPAEPEMAVLDDRPEGRIVMARWRQRRECAERREERLRGAGIDVSGVLADGVVVLTGVVDLERHERCLMAFRASEWDTYARLHGSALAARERARFEALDSGRRTATVRAGRLEIPRAMFARYVGETAEVVLLRLPDRAEIWSRGAFDIYTKSLPEIIIDPKDVSALGPPVSGRGGAAGRQAVSCSPAPEASGPPHIL